MNKVLSGSLLIAGTSIGAGMLALPVTTAASGWLGSLVVILLCWFVMFMAGLLVIEASLWLPIGTHFLSIAETTLGKWGKRFAWVSFLALLYSLMAAYLVGGGSLLQDALVKTMHHSAGRWLGPTVWVFVAAVIIFLGPKIINRVNRILIIGLILGFLLLISTTAPHVSLQHFSGGHFSKMWFALPVVITAFGYHIVLPTIRNHMTDDVNKFIKVLVWGTLIPLFVYIIWEILILGTVPLHGANGLMSIFSSGDPGAALANALQAIVQNSWVTTGIRFFIFFAIASSYLGIAFGLYDFIADGIPGKASSKKRFIVILLTFIPPLFYALGYPKGFILALSYAGIFVAILHGIIPVLMVWAGRRKGLAHNNAGQDNANLDDKNLDNKKPGYTTPGGMWTLGFIMLFSIVVIVCQLI